jgi:hypothetical protein
MLVESVSGILGTVVRISGGRPVKEGVGRTASIEMGSSMAPLFRKEVLAGWSVRLSAAGPRDM